MLTSQGGSRTGKYVGCRIANFFLPECDAIMVSKLSQALAGICSEQ